MGEVFTYWFLKTLLLCLLIVCGSQIYRNRNKSIMYIILAVLAYSLIQGLRYNRGADYMHYKYDMEGHWFSDNYEYGYKFLVTLLSHYCDFPYWAIFIFYSLLLIVAAILVAKKLPKAAIWFLPLFYIITGNYSENLVRQYIAISFLLFAYYFYLCDNFKGMFLSLLLVPCFHLSGLYAVLLFVTLVYVKIGLNKIVPYFFIFLYLFLLFFWKSSYLNVVSSYISMFGDYQFAFQSYVQNSDRWFTEEGSLSDILDYKFQLSFLHSFFIAIGNLITIYYGYKCVKISNQKFSIPYYFFIMSLLFSTIGCSDIELYIRFSQWSDFMTPLLVSLIIAYYPFKKGTLERKVIVGIYLAIYFYGDFFANYFANLGVYSFVWDS